jgi:hypothetical protein
MTVIAIQNAGQRYFYCATIRTSIIQYTDFIIKIKISPTTSNKKNKK